MNDEICQRDEEYWKESENETDKQIDTVKVRSLKFDDIRSVMVSKLDIKSRQKINKIVHKMNTSSNGNLMPLNNFKVLFPKATTVMYHSARTLVLLQSSRGMASHILLGALQYTMLVFGFSFLHTLRWY